MHRQDRARTHGHTPHNQPTSLPLLYFCSLVLPHPCPILCHIGTPAAGPPARCAVRAGPAPQAAAGGDDAARRGGRRRHAPPPAAGGRRDCLGKGLPVTCAVAGFLAFARSCFCPQLLSSLLPLLALHERMSSRCRPHCTHLRCHCHTHSAGMLPVPTAPVGFSPFTTHAHTTTHTRMTTAPLPLSPPHHAPPSFVPPPPAPGE